LVTAIGDLRWLEGDHGAVAADDAVVAAGGNRLRVGVVGEPSILV
jgi:hypothetical protein